MRPLASVIVPVKNEEHHLASLIPTLRAQASLPLEVIVPIAPGTTDRSRDIVEAHAPFARAIVGGYPGEGRNAGASQARGDVLVFLDADARPSDDAFLRRACDAMAHLDFSTADNIPMTHRRSYRAFYRDVQNPLVRLAARTGSPYAIGTCIIARRDAHQGIGGFDERVMFAEDVEYVRRAVRSGYRFGVLPRSISVLVDTRRLEKDGIPKVIGMSLRGEWERRVRRKEVTDLSVIDRDYFAHGKAT